MLFRSIAEDIEDIKEDVEDIKEEVGDDDKPAIESTAAEADEEADEEDDEEETEDDEDEKETTASEYSQEELIKVAYDRAEEKLASGGYTLADYVYTVIDDEKLATEIAEQAEKIAYVMDQNPLKTADDLISSIQKIASEL